tara:strand:+ start:89 stop:2080 length:1992 start_codon:yes stop_codon:yes gene_type:complete
LPEEKSQSEAIEAQASEALAKVKQNGGSLAALRAVWESHSPVVWARNSDIYRRAVDAALKLGESFLAYDIANEGLAYFSDEVRLLQLKALSLARTGTTSGANDILEELRKQGHDDEETMGILARTHKDLWMLSSTEEEADYHLLQSLGFYLEGYESSGGYYTGINAASMALVAGETEKAEAIAREVSAICEESLAKAPPDSGEFYWLEATAAEAALVVGDLDTASKYYRKATTEHHPGAAEVSRTRSQARFLLQHLGEDKRQLDDCFALPKIGLFSGHMFDQPHREIPRFPAAIENEVREAIEQAIQRHDIQVGYCSLANGGDLLYAESLLKKGGEVHIIIPFSIETFKKYSVRNPLVPNAELRFDNVLNQAATVRVLSEQGDPNDQAGYDYCNQVITGLAVLKSKFLGMDIAPMLLWDHKQGDGGGGTESVFHNWSNHGEREVDIIPINNILDDQLANGLVLPPPQPLPPEKYRAVVTHSPQEIRAMLFADVVGFSSWPEHFIPVFVREFFGRVAESIKDSSARPVYINTWGDAICAVFESVEHAGRISLVVQNLIRDIDWTKVGLTGKVNIRIGLHAGPVYRSYDALIGKDSYYGAHVNRAARIEPITDEGQIFASDAFAALAMTTMAKGFSCDYAGTRKLPKGAGTISAFLVRPTKEAGQ